MSYVELHLHDHYSALDGLNTPEEYMKRASEIGMTHLAQTNHGTPAGHREFQRAGKAAGITPILGIEAYISETDRFDRRGKAARADGTQVYNHLIVLAQNDNGLRNLYKLNEIGWTQGFYHKPRIDFDCLEEYSDDLIILSGCLNSIICKAIEAGDKEKAFETARRLQRIVPGRFYIELQGHNPIDTNKKLLTIADELKIPVVATSDCHYARREDLWIEEAMLILSTNPKFDKEFDFKKSQKMDVLERFNYLYPDRTMTFQEIEVYLHSMEEHMAAFAKQGIDRPDLYENTVKIAESIGEYPYYQGLDILPKPKNADPDVLLETDAWDGLKKRGLSDKQEYRDRLREELEIIKQKNFSSYFLIVADMVAWAKSQGIMVGPGRGSAAGSLLCYALGITGVDPIKYGLLFFRFIDPERDDFPDIDLDFSDKRRGEVKEYLRRKYGHVASIATFTYFKDKGVIKDAARVFRVPFAEVNRAMKAVNAPPTLDFFDVFVESPQGQEFNEKYPEVIDLARQLRGRIRGSGMHAAGVVLSREPLSDYMPIETATNTQDKNAPRIPLIAGDMNEVAEVGGIKMDALGLKTLSVIEDTLALIKDRYGKTIDLYDLDLADPKVFEMLSEGHTKGVFQCMLPTQPIHTIDGVKMAGDVVRGDMVLTHRGRFRQVVATMRRKSEGEMYRINLARQHSEPVYLTGEHPILRSDSDGNTSWVNVSDLTGGRKTANGTLVNWNDYVVVPKTATDTDAYFGHFYIDSEFARFLGLYAAEGCMEESGKMTLTFHKSETGLIEFSREVMTNVLEMNVRLTHRNNVTYVIGNKKKLAGLFRAEFGHGARNKRVPECLFSARREIIYDFLLGYAEGDGRILPSGSVGVQTASENLAWGIRLLAVNVGCFSEVKSHTRNAFGGQFDVYSLNYHLGEKTLKRVIETRDHLLVPVRDVEYVGGDYEVVNFEVEEDNSYVSSFVMHNCEATPYTNLLIKMNVNTFDDLSVSNALIRPGAMNVFGDSYLARKAGKEKAVPIHPDLDKYLVDTFFLPIYQEQSMRLVSDLADMGMSTANKVRKVTAKKQDVKLLADYQEEFINGSTPKIGAEKALWLWGSIEETASYAFNKSHSVAYSMLSYWTAWLKYYYPREFMVAILNNEGDKDAITDYLIECKRLGIRILLPHVNKSGVNFQIEGGDAIRMGLSNIKGLSNVSASRVLDKAPYSSYNELKEYVMQKGNGLTVKVLQGFNAIGAAVFEDNPRHGKERENFYEYLRIPAFDTGALHPRIRAQLTELADYEETGCYIVSGMVKSIKRGDGWARAEIVDETGSAGIFTEENSLIEPGQLYIFLVGDNSICRYALVSDVVEFKDSTFIDFLYAKGYPDVPPPMVKVISFKSRTTKAGKKMARMIVADEDKKLRSVLVFPQDYVKAFAKCKEGSVVDIDYGRLPDGTEVLRNAS